MHATLFSLVVTEDPELVFAWGMEITHSEETDGTESKQKAVLCIDAPNGEERIATHTSAEAARDRWSAIVPLTIVWDADAWADAWAEFNRQSLPDSPSNAPRIEETRLDGKKS